MKLFENSLYYFTLMEDETILRFDWTDETHNMNYEDFQEACSNYAGYAIENKTLLFLIDTRNFQYELPADYDEWRQSDLNPRYHRLGMKKHAYLMPSEYVAHAEDITPEDGTFVTRFFDDEQAALDWLKK